MLTPDQALRKIIGLMTVTGTEEIPLRLANTRVLAVPVKATRANPPFPASAMDGYAARSADIATGANLHVIGQSQAGLGFPGTIHAGQAVRIFTGAPVPKGADRILIQEDADRDGDTITIRANRDDASHIRPAGSDFKTNATFAAPKRLTPSDIGLLAAMNMGTIIARKKPIIALIATGNELVMPGEVPGRDQITSSNNVALAALLEQCGAEVRLLPIARDTSHSLNAAFALAHGADLIVTLGGASVGDLDLVQETAIGAGLIVDFWKIAMRPGKPLIAGKLGGTAFVGLSGNPVSAIVCGHLFLRPAIDVLLGLPARPLPRLTGTLSSPQPANGVREHYMRGTAVLSPQGWLLEPNARQDSALLWVLAQCNALIIAPANHPAQPAGAPAEFIQI